MVMVMGVMVVVIRAQRVSVPPRQLCGAHGKGQTGECQGLSKNSLSTPLGPCSTSGAWPEMT